MKFVVYRVVLVKGRGVIFYKCVAFDIRIGWCHATWPENFVAGPNDNQTLEEGFRHFIFTENRVHYCHPFFLVNKGDNAQNLRGVRIQNNDLEGRGRLIDGYARDVLITGNNGYWRDTANDTMILNGGENINIISNNFSAVHKDGVLKKHWGGTFLRLLGKVDGLNIHNNTFVGLKANMLLINHPTIKSENISLKNNKYSLCFTETTHALFLENGNIDILTIEDLPIKALSTTHMPYKRSNLTQAINNFTVDTIVYGSNYLHNFPSYYGRSTRKQGFYTGTGNTESQNILIGYFPKKVDITTKNGTLTRKITQDFTQEGATLNYSGLTVTGVLNELGTLYVWESY
ncbi:hypothetical protein [Acinetobacter sp. YH12135]|uniref:hypothetical protein n=1 Tax=Acinetobacter sp. YH12135 TaxID=2601119 RepID=UPI0015D2E799|nr:hypothetical protein [Acinetobacter sp. YH12135]